MSTHDPRATGTGSTGSTRGATGSTRGASRVEPTEGTGDLVHGRYDRDSYQAGWHDGRDEAARTMTRTDDDRDVVAEKRERFGGFNWGADFFGWLVAIGVTAIVASILGAIAAGVGSSLNVTQNEAQRAAGEVGLGTAIALLVVLMIGYFAGGYVAGRMSRFDGGRQGVGVWLIGLLVTILVAIVGAVAGAEYNILDRVNLPSLPIPTETATWGGLIALAAVVVGTLLAAFLGGKVGQRYHHKVDRYHS